MRPKIMDELEIESEIISLDELESQLDSDEEDDEFWLLEDEFDDGFDLYLEEPRGWDERAG